MIDRIARAFKHMHTGHPADPNLQPLSAEDVITRPPAAWDSAVWDLSSWDDPVGGVTIEDDRAQDVLSAIKRAAEFMRGHIGGAGAPSPKSTQTCPAVPECGAAAKF